MCLCSSKRIVSSSSTTEAVNCGTGLAVMEELPGRTSCPCQTPVPNKDREMINRRKAVLSNIIATSVLSLATLLMKASAIRGNEITLSTGLFGVFFGITGYIFSSRKGRTFSNHAFLRALANGIVFGGGFSFLYFLSFDFITMGDSTTVNFFCSFACCLIFESVILKVNPHFLTILSGVIGLIGVVLICQPEGMLKLKFDARYMFGVSLTGLSGVCGGLLYISMKKSSTLPYSLLMALYFPGAVLFAVPAHVLGGCEVCPASSVNRLIGLTDSALYAGVIYFFILGSQLSLPSVSFVLKLFCIVTSYIFQFLFLPFENISIYSVLGAVCISASLVIQTTVLLRYKSS